MDIRVDTRADVQTDIRAELDVKDLDLWVQGKNDFGKRTEAGIRLEVDKHTGEP